MEDGHQLFPISTKDIRRKNAFKRWEAACSLVTRKSFLAVRVVKHWNGNLSNFLSLKVFPYVMNCIPEKDCDAPPQFSSIANALQLLAVPILANTPRKTPLHTT